MSSSLSSSQTSNIRNSFELYGEDFHLLSQLETDSNKTFQIQFKGKVFKFTKEEIYLLSPKCYSDILYSFLPFKIQLPNKKKYQTVSSVDIIQALKKLSLLFSISKQIQIHKENVLVFKYISKVLENE
jgi:hypothetical protein